MRTKTISFVVIGAIAFSAWPLGARQVSRITSTLLEFGSVFLLRRESLLRIYLR